MRYKILAVGLVVVIAVVVLAITGLPGPEPARAESGGGRPSDEAVEFAQTTSDLLFNTLLAALLQEFAETTPDNVEEGKLSIGLVFADCHSNFRLVGKKRPLSRNNRPQDDFEEDALDAALDGQLLDEFDAVERVDGEWFYRRSFALSNFHPACVMCHPNFGPTNGDQMVGALMLKVPIPSRDDD